MVLNHCFYIGEYKIWLGFNDILSGNYDFLMFIIYIIQLLYTLFNMYLIFILKQIRQY